MHILVAFDGSAGALHVCRAVSVYAGERSNIQLTLLNVQRRPVQAWPDPGGLQTVMEQALQEQGQEQLDAGRMLLKEAGFAPAARVALGQPADRILEVAREIRADAILMGSGRSGLLASHALGSVALRVAPAAHCSVVLVPPEAALPHACGRRLRVTAAVDGSPAAAAAVHRLVACQPMLGEVEVDLVHFHPGLTFVSSVMPPHDDVLRKWGGEELQPAIARSAEELERAGVPFRVHGVAGDPATGISEFAKAHAAECVVMGTRGQGVIQHLVWGSVSLSTAQRCELPIALLR